MRSFIVLFLLFVMGSQMDLSAQNSQELMNGNHPFGEMVRFSKLTKIKEEKKSNLIGSPFLYEKWSEASIDFGDEQVRVENLKVNLVRNYLEVKIEGVEKVLDKIHFEGFTIVHPVYGEAINFVNAEDYKYEGEKLTGFMKIRDAGDFKILTHTTIRMVAPSRSSISESGGGGPMRVVKKERMYISKNDKLYRVKKRKHLYKIFSKKQKKVKAFIKDHNVSIKDEQGLMELALFYQTL